MIHTQIALVEIHTAVRCATRTTLAAIFSQARLCFSPSLHLCPVFRQSPFGDVSTSRLWALSIRSVSLVHFVMLRSSPAARRLSDHLFRPWHQLFRVSHHHHHLDHLYSRYDQRGECNPCVTCYNAAPSPRKSNSFCIPCKKITCFPSLLFISPRNPEHFRTFVRGASSCEAGAGRAAADCAASTSFAAIALTTSSHCALFHEGACVSRTFFSVCVHSKQ